LDSDILLRDNLVKKGGTDIKNSSRIFSKEAGLGIEELNRKLLGKAVRVYK
jgi:hypothetical protein